MKILIADDHAIVRKGLRQIVEQTGNMSVDEAVNGQDVLVKVRGERWDVLILDISMPGGNGLDVLQEVKHMLPNLPILVVGRSVPSDTKAISARFMAISSGHFFDL